MLSVYIGPKGITLKGHSNLKNQSFQPFFTTFYELLVQRTFPFFDKSSDFRLVKMKESCSRDS